MADYPTFFVWNHDDSDREHALRISGPLCTDPVSAVEEVAEREYDNGDPFENATYAVFDPKTNETTLYDVIVEYEPTFSAFNERKA